VTADDDERWAVARATKGLAVVLVVIWAQFVVAWITRPSTTRLEVLAGSAVFLVLVLHLFRLVVARTGRNEDGAYPPADFYRVSDAVRHGEAVADPALARRAQVMAEKQLGSSRVYRILLPLAALLAIPGLVASPFIWERATREAIFLGWILIANRRLWTRPVRLQEALERNRRLADDYERQQAAAGGRAGWY